MLNYFRETQEARFATSARRIYGYVSAGIVMAVMALVFFRPRTSMDFLGGLRRFLRSGRFPDQKVDQRGRTRSVSGRPARLILLRAVCAGQCNDSGCNGHHRNKTGKLRTNVRQMKLEGHRYCPSSNLSSASAPWWQQAPWPSCGIRSTQTSSIAPTMRGGTKPCSCLTKRSSRSSSTRQFLQRLSSS